MQSLFKSQILLREREHKSLVWVLLKESGVVIFFFCSSLLSQLQSICYFNCQHQSLVLVVKRVTQRVVYVSASSQISLKCWTRITSLSHTHLFRQNLLLSLKTKGMNHCIIDFNEENSPILSKETEYVCTAVIRWYNIWTSMIPYYFGTPHTGADSFCLHIYAFHWGRWILQEAWLCWMNGANSPARLPQSCTEVDQLWTASAAKTCFGGQGHSASGNLASHWH